mmetsp:Transcript_17783/g.37796  ORF Transcript_17783/g.37796 Transcript_17783/m.37796 type:complete len:203 (+) Transcript_17783:118-726(+)
MSTNAVGWLALSTTPPSLICSINASAAEAPTSSGKTPPAPTTSADSKAPFVVSATSVRPKPGESPDVLPLWMSVYTHTSGRKRFITARVASTRRFATCGETLALYATPRTRFTFADSVSCTGPSSLTVGSVSTTSPPPSGGAPLFWMSSEAPSLMPKCRSIGTVTVRKTSTPTSSAELVMPLRVMDTAAFANGASSSSGCTK